MTDALTIPATSAGGVTDGARAALRARRRSFFLRLAAGGITVAGAYALAEYAPWLDYDRQAAHARRHMEVNPAASAPLRELVRYATLAASGHNTQPWKFAIGKGAVEIRPDYARRLPAVDPADRELWISLGCALENLLITARAAGYAPEVTYPDAMDRIHVRLAAGVPHPSRLFDAIPTRQNTRSLYDGRCVERSTLRGLETLPTEPGIVLRFVLSPSDRETALSYVRQADVRQGGDQAFTAELIHWLRFDRREALASCDGLYAPCSGSPEVPRWLGRLFMSGTKPARQADADADKLRSSAGVVVIASERDDKTGWVRTGQAYERLALTMTALHIKCAFLNQPIEVADLRGQFQSAIGLGKAVPQLLMRFGYAGAMPFSLRRPVEGVLL